jgi:hypothetical protein
MAKVLAKISSLGDLRKMMTACKPEKGKENGFLKRVRTIL